MKTLTVEEFDKRMRESLKINRCSNCETFSGEVVLINPFLDPKSVGVICLGCGNKTSAYRANDCFVDESRLGTPVTAESLAKAIFAAVEEWNGENTEGGEDG